MTVSSEKPDMPVFLVEYDTRWPADFAAERERLDAVLRGHDPDIEHIGSTAIPGMAAKPVIDIRVLVDDIAEAPDCIGRLGSLEYHYHPYAEDVFPERRWFCKPNQTARTHHLHLVERGTAFHVDHLLFRDYLRTNAVAAGNYATLKGASQLNFPMTGTDIPMRNPISLRTC
ncbi:MAG: GrpB family protein [Gammaproteobacteria bacterium]